LEDDAVLDALSRNWWSIVLRGIAAVVLGLFAWARPDIFWASFIVVIAVYVIVDGVFALATGVGGNGGERWLQFGEGILGVAAGVLLLVFPGQAGTAIILVLGVWATATGVIEIMTAVRLRREIADEWLLGIAGVLSVVFGVMLIARPGFGQVTTTYVLGTYGIVFGAVLVLLGLRLRSHARRPLSPS
jgi:uncharacterized membrane protein HdeD (DUF308 family)